MDDGSDRDVEAPENESMDRPINIVVDVGADAGQR